MPQHAEAKDGRGLVLDADDLQRGAKGLAPTELPKQEGNGVGEEELAPFLALWKSHNGDICAIFESLNESPRKALRHPPRDGKEFARQYVAGFYTDMRPPAEEKECK